MIFQKQKPVIRKPIVSLINAFKQKVQVDNLPKSEMANKGKIIIQSYEYDEENLIGEGATSKVYLGRKCKDHKFVTAIKVVDKRKISKDKLNFDLLKQEIQIHKDIDHPNIVKCYQIVQKSTHFYFMLQYCPHGTLDGFIKKNQYLSESITTNILQQILSGYKYLMKHKIIHRDLKPPNILKSGYVWKICDFGFSVKGKKNLIGELNVGTPQYMAPQSLQRNYYSPKTDFFSFGVICYEMLFGTPPWQHKNQKVLLQMMLQQKINQQNLSTISNKNLSSFILKCCQPIQRKRITPEQFQQFDFWGMKHETKQEPTKSNKEKQFNRKSSQTFYVKSSFNTTKDVSNFSNTSTIKGSKHQTLQQILNKNEVIIDKQLYTIKIIYQILKHIRQLSFADYDDKQIFITILHRHSLHIIRRIKQTKFNHLCLKRWQQYIETASYIRQFQQTNQLSYKLDNILKGQTRRKNIIVIRIINRQYDELTYDKMLSNRCVNNIKQYLLEFIDRNLNDEVKAHSNYKKWVIHFLRDYYEYFNTYFDNSLAKKTRQIGQEQKNKKIEENYEEIMYSEQSFNKILNEIRDLKH